MRVIITAGGTGGHIYPALSIINKIKDKEPDSEFLYIGTHNRMEKDIVPKYDIPFKTIEIYGFNRKKVLKNVKTVKHLLRSYRECRKIIKEFNPDIVIGVGGYVTAPVIYAAHRLGYKTFIHEQNSVPGASNKFLMNIADKIGVSLKSSLDYFPKDKTIFTGNPCSENAINSKPSNKKDYDLSNTKKLVLIVMGSLGASKVNDYVCSHINDFKEKKYEVLYVTGNQDYDKISKINHPDNVKIVPYVEGLTSIMKKTDLMVTRAGASTLSEIIALNIPSILIPSPYVPNNHQFKNALDLVSNDAGILIEEKDLDGNILIDKIDELLNDKDKLFKMKNNLNKLKIDNSASIIYDIIKELVGR